jgi:hypothetical protein
VVWVLFSEISRVDHDSAFDENINNSFFLGVECLAFVPAEMDAHHGRKFPLACGEMRSYMLFA